jgi:hypothetical protein
MPAAQPIENTDWQLAEAEPEVSPATRKLRMLRTLRCGNKYERAARAQGATVIAGVDEVGRGALFGPVVAAAVILRRTAGFAASATQSSYSSPTANASPPSSRPKPSPSQ